VAKTAIPVDQFDPNTPPTGSNMFAVYDGSNFRATNRRATAIQWLNHSAVAKIFELVSSQWVERGYKTGWKKPDGTPCDHCGGPVEARFHYTSGWCFEKRKRRIVDPLKLFYLCRSCKTLNDNR
jgi:hypothetical protein